jgi:hypothetical protein
LIKNNPKSRKENIVVQDFEKEVLIYDLNLNQVYCLNETSSLIWHQCDGKIPVSEISRRLSQKLKTKVPEELVWLAIDQFKRDRLLDESNPVEVDFSGLSRREVIKKIGLASMITLPVIASVVAPNALRAQSLFPFLAACTDDSQCASGNCSSLDTEFPQICCVPGNIRGRPPGAVLGCITTQEACQVQAPSRCCSGSATWRNDLPPCATGRSSCICDPMP